MKKYRVFTSRHYIAVEFFDIEADTQRKAKNLAIKTAYKLYPSPKTTDNGWLADEPVEIPSLGYSCAPFSVKLVNKTTNGKVYQ